MSFVAVAIGGAAVLGLAGGIMGSNAAKDAANTQANAANNASQTQWNMYNTTRNDQAPWRQAGSVALGEMQDPSFQKSFTMSDFQADPGYAFRLQQGQEALQRSAAARGGLNSGATLKALTDYSQGSASQEYQNAYSRFTNDQSNRYNRLASIAGLGQTANGVSANAGQNAANQVGQNTMSAANAQAAGTVGATNAMTQGMSSGMNSWLQYQMMNRMFPQNQQPMNIGSSEAVDSYGGYSGFGEA